MAFLREIRMTVDLPENMLATAAIIKLKITPGPAIFLATMPATKYIPVPQHEPTPSDVRSSVVKHFWKVIKGELFGWTLQCRVLIGTVSFGFLLRGSSPCSDFSSFVRINLEKRAIPVPQAGRGTPNFIFVQNRVRLF